MILVYRTLGLGDFLTSVPALRAIRRHWPGDRVVLACSPALAPLVALAGAVDELLATEELAVPRVAGGVDVAINLHGRGPQSHAVLQELAPGRLIAFGADADWRDGEHEVQRWCRLLQAAGLDADPADLELAPPPPPPGGLEGATVIHPGADAEARRWPAARWAQVASALRAEGRRVVVTGGPSEVELAARVPGIQLAGRTDLGELAAIVAHAGLVLCGDTGVAHLATAFGTPSVLLFGPTSPAEWGPPPGRPRHQVLWSGTSGDPHAGRVDPGLLAITVEDVLSRAFARAA